MNHPSLPLYPSIRSPTIPYSRFKPLSVTTPGRCLIKYRPMCLSQAFYYVQGGSMLGLVLPSWCHTYNLNPWEGECKHRDWERTKMENWLLFGVIIDVTNDKLNERYTLSDKRSILTQFSFYTKWVNEGISSKFDLIAKDLPISVKPRPSNPTVNWSNQINT